MFKNRIILPLKRSFEKISLSSKSKKLLRESFVSYGGEKLSKIFLPPFLPPKLDSLLRKEIRGETKASRVRSSRSPLRGEISRFHERLVAFEMFIRCGNPYVDRLPENLISAARRTKACVDDTCFDRSSLCSLYLQLFKPRLSLKRPRDVSINFHRQRFNYRDNWLDELHDTMHNNFLIEIAIWRLGDLLCFRCWILFFERMSTWLWINN